MLGQFGFQFYYPRIVACINAYGNYIMKYKYIFVIHFGNMGLPFCISHQGLVNLGTVLLGMMYEQFTRDYSEVQFNAMGHQKKVQWGYMPPI